jgi:predicted lipoprotein
MAKTAGERRQSWLALGGFAAGCMVWQAACDPQIVDDPAPVETTVNLLASVGPSVVLPALSAFEERVAELQASIETWQGALSSDGDGDAERLDAQDAWVAAMMSWQRLEVMQIGPAGSSLYAVAGQDLRDEIYSWPTTNPCRIDQETAQAGFDDPNFFQTRYVNAYGLDGLERLLFGGADSACSPQAELISSGLWSSLSPSDLAVARADYALLAVGDVSRLASTLTEAWDPAGGDFSGQLALSSDDSPYASEQEALNAVFDAMFYVEKDLKDIKLATPMGDGDCALDSCPGDVELGTSGTSLSAIQANLEGFQALFTGGDGDGFDDHLRAAGHGELADEIVARTDAALASIEGVQGPLAEAVTDRADDVASLYAAVKSVSDLLKGDLATVMMLQIPSESAGDTD